MFLPAFAFEHRPAIIHFPWNGQIPKWLVQAKVVTTLNDVLPLVIPGAFGTTDEERKYRTRVQEDINRTNLLITISQYSKQEIISNFNVTTEPLVVPLAPTMTGVASTVSGEQAPYFIYVGGYDRRKGIDKLVNVFLQLHQEKKLTSRLVLTGSKSYFSEDFRASVAKGVSLGVIVEKGYVSDAELAALIRDAHALVYPSKYEGFGLPPLEAMALGCPVLTTQYTSIPEICGDAAFYVDPDDPESLAAGLVAFEDNESLRLDYRYRGLNHAKLYSWERSAEIYLNALRRLANE